MRTRPAALLVTAAMTIAALAAIAPAANAEPVDPASKLVLAQFGVGQNPSADVVYSADALFATAGGARVPTGTIAAVTFTSCGQTVQNVAYDLNSSSAAPDKTGFFHFFNESNTPDQAPTAINRRIGRSLEYSIVITSPGYDPYEISGSYSEYTVKRPTCEEILAGDVDGGGAVTVQKWSVKKGATTTAKVSKSLGITPTRAPGAKVTYAWKVGAKTVDSDRVFFVKKAYKGKKVSVRVSVSKPGAKSVSRVLRYGKAR